jgi:hypothetical protein
MEYPAPFGERLRKEGEDEARMLWLGWFLIAILAIVIGVTALRQSRARR